MSSFHKAFRGPTSRTVSLLLALAATVTAQEAHGEPAPRPSPLAEAYRCGLAQMRADRAPGLVFVLPPAGAPVDPELLAKFEKGLLRAPGGRLLELRTLRDVMLWRLQTLRWGLRPDVAALLLLTVPIVAEPSVCGAREGETIVLLSANGERMAGFAVDLADHGAVVDALGPHVLEKVAVEPRRANVPPEVAEFVAHREELLRLASEGEREAGVGLDPKEVRELQVVQQKVALRLTVAAPALVDLTGGRAVFEHRRYYWLEQDLPYGTEVGSHWRFDNLGLRLPLALRSTLRLLAK